MNGNTFTFEGEKNIKELGLQYTDDNTQCKYHYFNYIPLKLDYTNDPISSIEEIDNEVNKLFEKVLVYAMKKSGVRKVHKIWWDRFFEFGPGWNARRFTARFNVRFISENENVSTDAHVQFA